MVLSLVNSNSSDLYFDTRTVLEYDLNRPEKGFVMFKQKYIIFIDQ